MTTLTESRSGSGEGGYVANLCGTIAAIGHRVATILIGDSPVTHR
jgi:hypothetical protein